jgi:hypothetical protein
MVDKLGLDARIGYLIALGDWDGALGAIAQRIEGGRLRPYHRPKYPLVLERRGERDTRPSGLSLSISRRDVMLRTVGIHQSVGPLGLLCASCATLGAAYVWAVWMGAVEFTAVLGPLAGYLMPVIR